MIWVQHDFYKNFTNSIDSGDIDLSLDIFRSEISDLLTYKSTALYSLFDKLKIKYKKKSSYEELFDIVLREIKINDKFVRGISFLIAESNNVIKNNKGVSWEKLLNKITKGINIIGKYFLDNPKREKLFRKRAIEMIGLKSSITGDDKRELMQKDNTVLWIVGLVAVGVAGYFIYRYFDKLNQDKLRAESLALPKMDMGGVTPSMPIPNGIPTAPQQMPPQPIDPAYVVPSDVLLPENPPMPNSANSGGVQINVQPMAQSSPINQVANSNQL